MATTKMPIAWHQECLKNSKASNDARKRQIDRLTEEWKTSEHQNAHYECQINTAIEQGKDAFDRDLYLKKRKTNATEALPLNPQTP